MSDAPTPREAAPGLREPDLDLGPVWLQGFLDRGDDFLTLSRAQVRGLLDTLDRLQAAASTAAAGEGATGALTQHEMAVAMHAARVDCVGSSGRCDPDGDDLSLLHYEAAARLLDVLHHRSRATSETPRETPLAGLDVERLARALVARMSGYFGWPVSGSEHEGISGRLNALYDARKLAEEYEALPPSANPNSGSEACYPAVAFHGPNCTHPAARGSE